MLAHAGRRSRHLSSCVQQTPGHRPTGFVEGTAGTAKGGAKSDIWSKRADFDAGMKNLQDEAAKLAAAAKTNNLDNLKAAFGETAKTCKACHDNFRNQ